MFDSINFNEINYYLEIIRDENTSIDKRKIAIKKVTELLNTYFDENESYLMKDYRNTYILLTLNIINTLLTAFCGANNEKNIYYLAAFFWFMGSIVYSLKLNYTKESIDRIKKYKYFLENQDTINQEIIERFIEENKVNNNYSIDEAPVITVADIDDMDIKELKETVQLIRSSHN